jgi:hypothetical protein
MENLFIRASREAFRFQSVRGELTTEQLWELPLQHKSGFDLDSVAKTVNNDLKTMAEGSFVNTNKNPAIDRQEAKLEVVKYVISVKLLEAEQAKLKAEAAVKRQKLLDILGKKQDAELENLTPEQIQAQLAALKE